MQHDQWLGYDGRCAVRHSESKPLTDRRDDKLQLHQREMFSKTHPRPGAEGHIRVLLPSGADLRRKPLGPELVRRIPERTVPVKKIVVEIQIAVRRDVIPTD